MNMSTGRTANLSARHIYRRLLRLLETPTLPEHLERKAAAANLPRFNASQEYSKEQFRNKENEELTKQLAATYLELQQNLQSRAHLYELDTGAEKVLSAKEMSRRAAARAGLALPEVEKLD